MAAPGITLIQKFAYRGNPNEEFSNTYHFTGDAPDNPSDWGDLALALIALVKTALTDEVTILRAYCYEDTDDDSVYTYDLAAHLGVQTGSVSVGSHHLYPGDAACWIRWNTGRTNSKGRAIYLRKYYHSVLAAESGDDIQDRILAAQSSALDSLGEDIMSSSDAWPGLAGPDGVAPTGWLVSPYVTTRTLKRRGARPT